LNIKIFILIFAVCYLGTEIWDCFLSKISKGKIEKGFWGILIKIGRKGNYASFLNRKLFPNFKLVSRYKCFNFDKITFMFFDEYEERTFLMMTVTLWLIFNWNYILDDSSPLYD
jgi:hypothetical protein